MTLNELIKKAKSLSSQFSGGDVPMIHENGKPFDVEFSIAIGDDGSINHITVREKCLAYFEKQKEQKPVQNPKKGCPTYPLSVVGDLLAKTPQEPIEFAPKKKPEEWSEEDEEMLNSCISSIEKAKENRYAYKETDGDTSYDHETAWLKSLRSPKSSDNWKPSEEQMNAFKGYIEDFQKRAEAAVGGWNNFDVMIRLYEQLKKL